MDILAFLLRHPCVKIKSSPKLLYNLSPRLMERPITGQRKHLLAGLSNMGFFKPLHTSPVTQASMLRKMVLFQVKLATEL